jgi:Fe2+ transport system protein B
MKKLIKIEWMKVKDYRTFWVLSVLYLISIFGANLIAFRIQQSIFEREKTKMVANLFIVNTPY